MKRFIAVLPIPKFVDGEIVLAIHNRQIERFGGTAGVRDRGLLDSALAQPQATFAGEMLHLTISEQASAYLYHLAMNHPFVDGNKRTAFAVMDTFLTLNGYRISYSNDEAYVLVMRVARGELNKENLARELAMSVKKM